MNKNELTHKLQKLVGEWEQRAAFLRNAEGGSVAGSVFEETAHDVRKLLAEATYTGTETKYTVKWARDVLSTVGIDPCTQGIQAVKQIRAASYERGSDGLLHIQLDLVSAKNIVLTMRDEDRSN